MFRSLILGLSLSATAAFSPASAPLSLRSQGAVSSVQMSEERATSRRALLASLLVAAPAAANAMAVPGFNSPGLVPAKKVPRNPAGYSGDNFAQIRDAETNHFWSPQGMIDSVPKMKGIITPKPNLNYVPPPPEPEEDAKDKK